jgi:hypothetical protein
VDAGSLGWISDFKIRETFAQAGCVFVRDGEDTDATLGAAGFANEMLAATAVGVGYCRVHNLDES